MATVAVHPPKTPVTKGSQGIAAATLPNICKMPPPPPPFCPTPLPNIGQSGKNPKGYSTSVKIEGNFVATTGSSFDSVGDIASKATGGGVVSNNCEGPTKFISPGELTVRIQTKFVQQLGDLMLNNCGVAGAPPNSATMAGVFQAILAVASNTEKPSTACSAGAHVWESKGAAGAKSLDDKINDAKNAPTLGAKFEGAAAAHNKASGDLQRSDQMSGDTNDEKVWWICAICGFKREGDQLHDGPGGKPAAVEAKAKTTFSERDARQLGRNCQAVAGGGASSLIYKLPAGPQANWLVNHIRGVGKALNVVIEIVRV
jgi:hypothetical protein